MKTKLIKVKQSGEYLLKMEGVGYITTYESTLPYKLSLKNCQTIECGYDLDKLAKNSSKKERLKGTFEAGFKDGFQKALEILGDKKFSEDDVNLAFVLGKNKDESRINKIINSRLQQTEWDVEIEMIQDYSNRSCKTCNLFNTNNGGKRSCELELQSRCASFKNDETLGDFWVSNYDDEDDATIMKPKFDADGCIILKRK